MTAHRSTPTTRPMNSNTRSKLIVIAASLLLTASACKEDNAFFNPDLLPAGEVCFEGRETLQEVTTFQDPAQLDVLIVVSTAPGTEAIQQRLAAAVPRFISLMRARELDFQLGVITGDAGDPASIGALKAGGQGISGCEMSPRIVTDEHGERAGTFAACNVLQGSEGADAQELIEATSAAFGPRNLEPLTAGGNAGFLRARASLLVVYVTDRDDCSNDNLDLSSIDGETTQTRCEHALDRLADPDDLAQELIALKSDPGAVAVAVIGGSDDGRDIDLDDELAPTCADAAGRPVFPATRLIRLADLFRPRAAFESACSASYGLSVSHISLLSEPDDVVVCPDARLTEPPLAVTLDGEDLDNGQGGYVFLGSTDACPNGAVSIDAGKLAGAQGALQIRYCGR